MVEQGSAEWLKMRLGKATASKISDVIATTKTGPSALRTNYAAQLVAERLTGNVAESFTNAAMEWGTAKEADARSAYEYYVGATVQLADFIDHPTIPMSGASPDGLVGSDGLVEIKCPNTATHIETLLGEKVASKYVTQIQWQLACTGRSWCDFVSYDPRLPEEMSIWIKRVERDDKMIAELSEKVSAFLAEVASTVASLEAKFRRQAA